MFHKKNFCPALNVGQKFFLALDSLGGYRCISTVGQFFANGIVFGRGVYVHRDVASLRSLIFRTNLVTHKLTKHIASSSSTFGSSKNAGKGTSTETVCVGSSHSGCSSTSTTPMAPVTMPEMNTATIIRRYRRVCASRYCFAYSAAASFLESCSIYWCWSPKSGLYWAKRSSIVVSFIVPKFVLVCFFPLKAAASQLFGSLP